MHILSIYVCYNYFLVCCSRRKFSIFFSNAAATSFANTASSLIPPIRSTSSSSSSVVIVVVFPNALASSIKNTARSNLVSYVRTRSSFISFTRSVTSRNIAYPIRGSHSSLSPFSLFSSHLHLSRFFSQLYFSRVLRRRFPFGHDDERVFRRFEHRLPSSSSSSSSVIEENPIISAIVSH